MTLDIVRLTQLSVRRAEGACRELRQALDQERALSASERSRLEPLIQAFEAEELLDLQADYCELFDRSRSLSLHLSSMSMAIVGSGARR